MKSSVFSYVAGGLTVLGVWIAYANRCSLEKLVHSINNTTEQTIQKFKAKMDSMATDNQGSCQESC